MLCLQLKHTGSYGRVVRAGEEEADLVSGDQM